MSEKWRDWSLAILVGKLKMDLTKEILIKDGKLAKKYCKVCSVQSSEPAKHYQSEPRPKPDQNHRCYVDAAQSLRGTAKHEASKCVGVV